MEVDSEKKQKRKSKSKTTQQQFTTLKNLSRSGNDLDEIIYIKEAPAHTSKCWINNKKLIPGKHAVIANGDVLILTGEEYRFKFYPANTNKVSFNKNRIDMEKPLCSPHMTRFVDADKETAPSNNKPSTIKDTDGDFMITKLQKTADFITNAEKPSTSTNQSTESKLSMARLAYEEMIEDRDQLEAQCKKFKKDNETLKNKLKVMEATFKREISLSLVKDERISLLEKRNNSLDKLLNTERDDFRTRFMEDFNGKVGMLEKLNGVVEKVKDLRELDQKREDPDDGFKTRVVNLIESEFQCAVCSEVYIEAVATSCKHIFCASCIYLWRKKNSQCPICKEMIIHLTPLLAINSFVEQYFNTIVPDQKPERELVCTERRKLHKHKDWKNLFVHHPSGIDLERLISTVNINQPIPPPLPAFSFLANPGLWYETALPGIHVNVDSFVPASRRITRSRTTRTTSRLL